MVEGKLTWNDLAYDTDGFMTSVYQFVLISLIKCKHGSFLFQYKKGTDLDGLTSDLVCPTREILDN